jgi:GDPmannose 4,6-dehydratase
MMKKALIVGSGGQDGTLLTRLLMKNNYNVVGLKRNDLDILNPRKVIDFYNDQKPEEIYYLAAYHHSSENIPYRSGDTFRKSMDIHFYGLVNFLEAISLNIATTRLFFASSSHIFGVVQEGIQTEQSVYSPQSEYAITKVAGIYACQHYRKVNNIFASVGILYNHESPLRPPHFLSKKIAIAAARIGKDGCGYLELGDLDAMIDWGDASDTVDAMHKILQLKKAADYIVATGQLHSVREFADVAFRYVGLDYKNHVVSKKNAALRNNYIRVGDSKKLRVDTGWEPSITFEKMINNLVQFEIDVLSKVKI